MDPTSALMLLAPFVVLAVATAFIVRWRSRLQDTADAQAPQWAEVARQFGLSYSRPSPAAGYMQGIWENRKLVATVIRRGRGARTSFVTQIAAYHKSPLPLGLYVAPKSWPRPSNRAATGDHAFDEAFDATGPNSLLISRILDDEVRGAIRTLQASAPLRSVNEANVLVEFPQYGVDGESLARTFRLVAAVCEALEHGLARADSPPDKPTGPFR